MNYREIGVLAALKQAGITCETPGEKIKSENKGRGLARGEGKGPMGIPIGEKIEALFKKTDKEDDIACETPGEKIRSMGKGRGLAKGKGKGPLGVPIGEKDEVWRALAEKGASDYHDIGVQLALQDAGLIKEAQLNPEQLAAAKQLFGIGGGLAGATGGGLLGRHLGGSLADKFDIDPETGKLVGAGLGALGGGALGGLAGYNLARLKYPGAAKPAEEPVAESVSFMPDQYQSPMGLFPNLYGGY